MGAPARLSPAPEPDYHCDSCVCDPSSPRAVERASRVEPFTIPSQSRVFCALTRPEALADIMRWYGEAKQSVRATSARPMKLSIELVAHPNEIEVRVHEVRVRSYRRRNTR